MLKSTKKYGHEVGLSTAFRQWRADSHCKYVHGYALSFKFTFCASELDARGWVVDFGGLKALRKALEDQFDHKLLVASDDPHRDALVKLYIDGVADVRVVARTGCEAFAAMAYRIAHHTLAEAGFAPRCWVESVEVSEHGANSAIYHAGDIEA